MTKIHFIGIGGAGMAPLASIALSRGETVTGSDSEANGKTRALAEKGAYIHIGHDAAYLEPGTELVVYSSAVPKENPERAKARTLGIEELSRGAFLARLAGGYRRLTAISGSHGKTSITAMLAHILVKAGLEPGFLIGAALQRGDSSSAGKGDDIFVSEVDESDGTHTLVTPYLGIVPNLDDDHAWSVGGEEALHRNFRTFAARSVKLLYYASPLTDRLFAEHPGAIRLESSDLPCGRWHGVHAWNARLAIRAAAEFGVEGGAALQTLEDFAGVARRFTLRYESPELAVIEDYAHHPAELAGSLVTLRSAWPGRRLEVIFQPHRYARLEKYLDAFALELAKADRVIIAPVFAAWCEKGPKDGGDLAAKIGPKAEFLQADWSEIAARALESDGAPRVLAVIGAGDIERIFPFLPGANHGI